MKPLNYLIGSAILSAYIAIAGVANAEDVQKPKDEKCVLSYLKPTYPTTSDIKTRASTFLANFEDHVMDIKDLEGYVRLVDANKDGGVDRDELSLGERDKSCCKTFKHPVCDLNDKNFEKEVYKLWGKENTGLAWTVRQSVYYILQFKWLDTNGDGVIDSKDDLNKDNVIDEKDRELFKKQKEKK